MKIELAYPPNIEEIDAALHVKLLVIREFKKKWEKLNEA